LICQSYGFLDGEDAIGDFVGGRDGVPPPLDCEGRNKGEEGPADEPLAGCWEGGGEGGDKPPGDEALLLDESSMMSGLGCGGSL